MWQRNKNIIQGALVFLALLWVSFVLGQRLSPEWIQSFDNAGIMLGYLSGAGAIAAFTIALVKAEPLRNELRRWLSAQDFRDTGEEVALLRRNVKALIIPVGNPLVPEWLIRQLEPEKVSLLCSRGRQHVALELAEALRGLGVEIYPPLDEISQGGSWLEQPLDPLESRNIVRGFIDRYRGLGIEREEILVDTTGGTAPMSIGAFQAAEERAVSTVYATGSVKNEGKIKNPKDPEAGTIRFMSNHG